MSDSEDMSTWEDETFEKEIDRLRSTVARLELEKAEATWALAELRGAVAAWELSPEVVRTLRLAVGVSQVENKCGGEVPLIYRLEQAEARCAEQSEKMGPLIMDLDRAQSEVKELTEKLAATDNSLDLANWNWSQALKQWRESEEKCAALVAALEIAQCMCSACAPGETFLTGVDCKHKALDDLVDHAPPAGQGQGARGGGAGGA